jgi:hypothetical protein
VVNDKTWTGLALAGTLLLAAAATTGLAQELAPPPLPPPIEPGQPFEPQVTIRRTQREVIYEYRRNGALFLVRVQPAFGPPYYFFDFDGDGSLDYRPGDPIRNNVQQWILWRW